MYIKRKPFWPRVFDILFRRYVMDRPIRPEEMPMAEMGGIFTIRGRFKRLYLMVVEEVIAPKMMYWSARRLTNYRWIENHRDIIESMKFFDMMRGEFDDSDEMKEVREKLEKDGRYVYIGTKSTAWH